jgi:Flp pilus assembly pilin Flp
MWGGSTMARLAAASHSTFRQDMLIKSALHLVIDDSGQDLVEYALLSGVLGVAGVLLFPIIAGKMGDAYTSWQSAAQTAWEPDAPCGCQ